MKRWIGLSLGEWRGWGGIMDRKHIQMDVCDTVGNLNNYVWNISYFCVAISLELQLKGVSHQWCDLFSSTTAQLYATHGKRE